MGVFSDTRPAITCWAARATGSGSVTFPAMDARAEVSAAKLPCRCTEVCTICASALSGVAGGRGGADGTVPVEGGGAICTVGPAATRPILAGVVACGCWVGGKGTGTACCGAAADGVAAAYETVGNVAAAGCAAGSWARSGVDNAC
ncbi:hypothetical protein GCM10007913_16710 [Devosia yakushimensis]|uniref:Uncharacterized protein n=1 Tax=Devosia yakushimensis TaxID=470028 RepID=A0ABQ5UCB9_9HYPH|nr:hypothetical protein GCM10007913_16710 [Devosia yakushimensis]